MLRENSKEIRCLASYVTFRQLYDQERRDIYDIVSLFAKYVINKRNLVSFEVSEVVDYINIEFGFRIPDYILQSALKRIDYLERKNRKFHIKVGSNIGNNEEIEEKVVAAKTINDSIFELLSAYVEEKIGKKLTISESNCLAKEFTSFLLDETSADRFGEYIGAFIITNEHNNEVYSQIQTIKEGAVLFAGLTYGGNVDENVKWNSDIIIYVENEILFHLAGFNGDVFKRIADDLFNLISEMNSKNKKHAIKIKYFPEVESDINQFFNKAQDIVMRRDVIDENNYAMAYIVKDCKTESDVIEKKASFMRMLRNKGITKAAEYNYYSEENQKYNLEAKDVINKYEISEEKMRYIKHLNYVNILRKAKTYTKIKDCEYILLTETGRILQMSKDFVEQDRNVPLAINMYLLTNRLWYDLNKGFNTDSLPATFDILLKSKIVLASLVTKSIATKYDEAKKKFKNGELSSDDLISTIVALREEAKKPEEVNSESLDDLISFISEKDISLYRNEKIRLEKSVDEYKEIIAQKLEEEKKRELSEQKLKVEMDSLKQENAEKQDYISGKQEKLKEKAENKIKKRIRYFKGVSIIAILSYILLVIIVYSKLNAFSQGIFAISIPLLPPVFGEIYAIIKEREGICFAAFYRVCLERYSNYVKKKIYAEYELEQNIEI